MIERPTLRSDRYARGEDQGGSKLTEDQVKEIIATIGAYPDAAIGELAIKYGVSSACISKIKNDRLWMHIPRPWKTKKHRKSV